MKRLFIFPQKQPVADFYYLVSVVMNEGKCSLEGQGLDSSRRQLYKQSNSKNYLSIKERSMQQKDFLTVNLKCFRQCLISIWLGQHQYQWPYCLSVSVALLQRRDALRFMNLVRVLKRSLGILNSLKELFFNSQNLKKIL